MATRSNIAIKNMDGTITGIYCHWDGYPAHNGEMLRRYYNTTDKVLELIALGSLSALRPEIGEQQDFDNRDTQKDDWTLAYHRDRGEELVIRTYQDAVEYVEDGEEYMYLWDGQNWLVNDHGEKDPNSGFPIFDFVENKITPKMLEELGWENN